MQRRSRFNVPNGGGDDNLTQGKQIEMSRVEFRDYSTRELEKLKEVLTSDKIKPVLEHIRQHTQQEREEIFDMRTHDMRSMTIFNEARALCLGKEWVLDLVHRIEEELERRTREAKQE